MVSTRGSAKGAIPGIEGGYRQWQGHRNRSAGYVSQFSGWTTTFFFYNFPEELEAKFLWNSFRMYGKAVDVYIPSKRDKRGKRFGFVRMAGVKNEIQMERQLNMMWIGSYKLKVKIADDRGKKPAESRKIQGAVKDNGSLSKMNRLVQPGKSYAQVVKGKGKWVEKVQIQPQDKDEEDTAEKEDIQKRVVENTVVVHLPTGEELQWLEGGMVAVVRSLGLISEIQERIGADGGLISLTPIGGRRVLLSERVVGYLSERVVGYLSEYMKINEELFDLWFEAINPWEAAPEETSRMVWLRILGVPLKAWSERCFQKIGETVGEVQMIHEDTKNKSILWDGRVLILCTEARRIAKRINLKVGEQMYEIEIAEEEWRSDPDWWLTENDRNNDQKTESDDISDEWSQNEEQEMGVDVICDDDDVSSDSVHLMKDMGLISNLKKATGKERWGKNETEREIGGDEGDGRAKEHGLQRHQYRRTQKIDHQRTKSSVFSKCATQKAWRRSGRRGLRW
ncbi:hypothetical protein SLEP1_g23702 [Rubroshorea leprosula]|uniref:RRM domain-containing protein n=1 Tax=Rubroshorea leprosula TaxID=152421 RepID=A0AAV5JIG2_9ROSI|nr:hypothetical protein SLEP1_g23702 [Rubroshorea leprosula]